MHISSKTELPRFLLDLLTTCPRAGTGVHNWLFKVARQLHAHRRPQEIVSLLAAIVTDCGRPVPINEIQTAVEAAQGCAWRPGKTVLAKRPAAPTWPELNPRGRTAILAAGNGLADLWETSPVRLETNEVRTEELIDTLFPGNPLLCCGASSCAFDTRPRETWRGELAALQLIVPSPMSAKEGTTKTGKASTHTLSNTGPRRFLVVEFDSGTTDEHAALLLHLADYAPLVLAVHSGNKSLHAWFYCVGHPDGKVQKFFRYAVSLGADPATWTKSQFVRMPDGTRDNGNRQTVFFFNPRPLNAH